MSEQKIFLYQSPQNHLLLTLKNNEVLISELEQTNAQCELYLFNRNDINQENQEAFNSFITTLPMVPVFSLEQLSLSVEQLKEMNSTACCQLIEKSYKVWSFQNNMKTMREFQSLSQNLKASWAKDLDGFMREFWLTMKKNLGASEVDIFYNDLELGKTDGDKNKLFQNSMRGHLGPAAIDVNDAEKRLMDSLFSDMNGEFKVKDFDDEAGELTLLCQIQKSPLLIMAKTKNFTPIQKNICHGIVNALQ